tara:strand:+ start:458 stop:2482 length:2025 start_codon:yes stop_codon:yes gene_type:complete
MICAIIQARCESVRFPFKVLSKINGKTLIEILVDRLKKSKYLDRIIIATSNDKSNKKLIKILKENNIDYFIGSKKDVLSRYYLAAKKYKAKTIVRLTGDNPLIHFKIVDQFIREFKLRKYDYISDSRKPSYPDGVDVEVLSFKVLNKIFKKKNNEYDKEHVTSKIKDKNSKFSVGYKRFNKNYSHLRLTVDEKDDYECIKNIFNYFFPREDFTLNEIIKLYEKKPKLFKNMKIRRDEGSKLHSGQKMWKRANRSIPNGNSFFSKNPDIVLPKFWPTYYSKAKGCEIWDLDNKKYKDFYLMGVGTNLLGYARKEIDDAVKSNIDKSNMSSLNCVEEVLLAEKLVEIHPWAEQAKFARTGAEANAIAVRIARAYSKKQNIAICGYHGWHDWYLAANLKNKTILDNHLLSNLRTQGVLNKLRNTVFAFEYNDLKTFENLIKNKDIGCVIMEVSRNYLPSNDFLIKIRDLTKKNKIVLIFDECSSGFREVYGGLHLKYKVFPDICMFGKALGNGYAITSIIGRGNIMKFAKESFISSTFWSERSGYTAGLKTLEIMKKTKSWQYVSNYGNKIKSIWQDLSKKHDIKLQVNGIDAVPNFSFDSKNNLKYKTFISQEMLKNNFLCANSIFVSTAHNIKDLNLYKKNMDKIFYKIKEAQINKNIDSLIDGEVCQSSFKRMN